MCRSEALFKIMGYLLALIIAFVTTFNSVAEGAENQLDINTHLMQSTFRILGPSGEKGPMGQELAAVGTCFVVFKPLKGEDDSKDSWKGTPVLVTAAHVLDNIVGNEATLELREKLPTGKWQIAPVKLQLKKSDGSATYVKHGKLDIAVMYLTENVDSTAFEKLKNIPPISWKILGGDDVFTLLKLHPGSALFCLGYPLGLTSSAEGFPILRGGLIASYPLEPAREIEHFEFDFEVYGGNSGGPVYYYEPGFEAEPNILFAMKKGVSMSLIGLVIQEYYADSAKTIPLKFGRVLNSCLIMDTIKLLPDCPQK